MTDTIHDLAGALYHFMELIQAWRPVFLFPYYCLRDSTGFRYKSEN